MRALDVRIAELNTAIAGPGPAAPEVRAERDECERELSELEDRYGPAPEPYTSPDREAG